MGTIFSKKSELPITSFDWGDNLLRLEPKASGCTTMVVMDVTLEPGGMHNFHKHPDQDEILIVIRGSITQYVGEEMQVLQAGDSAYVARNTVHASFNDSMEATTIQVVLAPPMGESGYGLIDVYDELPWKNLRG
ncbi:MAG: cupin domain-containing protein [Streptomycetaceae bacterium]|nr:MAG: cupin domain-containing protein [Streptomycetaceae bacterium]